MEYESYVGKGCLGGTGKLVVSLTGPGLGSCNTCKKKGGHFLALAKTCLVAVLKDSDIYALPVLKYFSAKLKASLKGLHMCDLGLQNDDYPPPTLYVPKRNTGKKFGFGIT